MTSCKQMCSNKVWTKNFITLSPVFFCRFLPFSKLYKAPCLYYYFFLISSVEHVFMLLYCWFRKSAPLSSLSHPLAVRFFSPVFQPISGFCLVRCSACVLHLLSRSCRTTYTADRPLQSSVRTFCLHVFLLRIDRLQVCYIEAGHQNQQFQVDTCLCIQSFRHPDSM